MPGNVIAATQNIFALNVNRERRINTTAAKMARIQLQVGLTSIRSYHPDAEHRQRINSTETAVARVHQVKDGKAVSSITIS